MAGVYGQTVQRLDAGHELSIQVGNAKVVPASCTPSEAPSKSTSCEDLGADPDADRHRGMCITFRDLTYTVKSHHNKKVEVSLLSSISGYFSAGQMSALMGPSGSGKTTLLDVLAGRKTSGRTEGSVLFAGVRPSSMFLRRFTGYVEQFDTLVDVLTVEEMLLYTAELKRPLRESTKSKKQAVNVLIQDLALTGCRATRIGNSLQPGILGGQRKRVNIGIALITNPSVLFLDEPTSGLDSYTSNEVMTVVKRLVKTGITICATIHSPTPYAFRLFDRMLLLLSGRTVYFGQRGQQAIDYFNGLPLAGEGLMLEALKQGNNEAEWIVDLTTQADRQGRASVLAGMYQNSGLRADNDAELDAAMTQRSTIRRATLAELAVQHATVTPFWWGLWIMLRYRTFKNYTSVQFLIPRVGDKLIFALLIFSLWWGAASNFAGDNLVNVAALLYTWSSLPAFGAAACIPSIVLERPLYTRERNDGLYRVITYLCAKMLDELLVAILASFVFSVMVFYGVRFQGSLLLFWLVYLTTLSIGVVLAYTVAACAPNMDVANAALPGYLLCLLFFGGFIIRQPSMPAYWRYWAPYGDFMSHAWHAQMVNEFGGRPDALLDGVPILEFYNVRGTKWANLGFEATFFVGFFCFAWLALAFCKHSSR